MSTSDLDCQYILNLHRGPCQGRRGPRVTEARVSSEVVLLRLGVPLRGQAVVQEHGAASVSALEGFHSMTLHTTAPRRRQSVPGPVEDGGAMPTLLRLPF